METFNLKLTTDELNAILGALGELPLKHSIAIFNTIHQQVNAQKQQQQQQEISIGENNA